MVGNRPPAYALRSLAGCTVNRWAPCWRPCRQHAAYPGTHVEPATRLFCTLVDPLVTVTCARGARALLRNPSSAGMPHWQALAGPRRRSRCRQDDAHLPVGRCASSLVISSPDATKDGRRYPALGLVAQEQVAPYRTRRAHARSSHRCAHIRSAVRMRAPLLSARASMLEGL